MGERNGQLPSEATPDKGALSPIIVQLESTDSANSVRGLEIQGGSFHVNCVGRAS